MANLKISALASLAGANVQVTTDILPMVQTSTTANKKILISELAIAMFNGPTFVAPVLGTPASGVATNLTGTATGMTVETANSLKFATGVVYTSTAAIPSVGQFLVATSTNSASFSTVALTGVSIDVLAGGIGMMAMMQNTGSNVPSNSATAGSNLRYVGFDSSSIFKTFGTPSGTWRNISGATVATNESCVFQRIS